jgi:serine/threonine protein kinase
MPRAVFFFTAPHPLDSRRSRRSPKAGALANGVCLQRVSLPECRELLAPVYESRAKSRLGRPNLDGLLDDLGDRIQSSLGEAYSLERELGGGGMSRVFLAEERALGRKIVIKVLPPELTGDLSVERFRRETKFAAQLQHPHIVPVLAAGEADGVLYFTTPFVPGESLRQRLRRDRQLSVDEAIRLTCELAEALEYGHFALLGSWRRSGFRAVRRLAPISLWPVLA